MNPHLFLTRAMGRLRSVCPCLPERPAPVSLSAHGPAGPSHLLNTGSQAQSSSRVPTAMSAQPERFVLVSRVPEDLFVEQILSLKAFDLEENLNIHKSRQ